MLPSLRICAQNDVHGTKACMPVASPRSAPRAMRPLLAFALTALLACASEPAALSGMAAAPETVGVRSDDPAPADSFDVQAWLAEVRALDDPDYDALVARSGRLADRLGAVLDWRRACDTYRDPSTGEEVYDPIGPEQDQLIGRGLMDVNPLGTREAAVAVLCSRGAYQGSWVLVHVEEDRAALVRTPALNEDFQPTASETAAFGEPLFEPDSHLFSTFVKSRGPGDCGVLTRYRLGAGGQAETLEVRAHDCDEVIPDELPPPEEWPIVYPR